MTSRANSKASAASAAGWSPPRSLSPDGKAFTATHPALYLHIYCNFEGVQVNANVDYLDAKGRLQRTVVAKTSFRPPEVSEALVVEWGMRCLRRWLEENLVTPPEPE